MNAVILSRVKYPHNLAAAIRASACFGIDKLYWTGQRFNFEDGQRLPREERMKGYRNVEFRPTERPFDLLSSDMVPVCVELVPNASELTFFEHPKNAAYVFGPEDGHVPQSFRGLCHQFVYIPANHCLNLAAAINVILAHRTLQRIARGLDEPLSPVIAEQRGIIDIRGWESA